MKRFALFIITLLISMVLTACSYHQSLQAQVSQNCIKETWMRTVNTNPNRWLKGADPWYFTGEPYQLNEYAKNAPISATITDTEIRPSNFDSINVSGNFKVQIIGHQASNSVEIVGPNGGVRQVIVSTRNHTLYLQQNPEYKGGLSNVIVRIGIRSLHHITASGYACITGRNITSRHLVIDSCSTGIILLDGNINLTEVNQDGPGSIIVLGAYTRDLTINVHGNGIVNVAGRVGIHCINNFGGGCVNIIGAMSDDLTIEAGGQSSTVIAGFANVRRVIASGDSRVYLYWVCSRDIRVVARDRARVGLAGYANNLTVDVCNTARFEGKCLRAQSAYVRTYDDARANISAEKKIFANARWNSSVYYFGSPSKISRFYSENATIIPMYTTEIPTPAYPNHQAVPSQFKIQGTG